MPEGERANKRAKMAAACTVEAVDGDRCAEVSSASLEMAGTLERLSRELFWIPLLVQLIVFFPRAFFPRKY